MGALRAVRLRRLLMWRICAAGDLAPLTFSTALLSGSRRPTAAALPSIFESVSWQCQCSVKSMNSAHLLLVPCQRHLRHAPRLLAGLPLLPHLITVLPDVLNEVVPAGQHQNICREIWLCLVP